MKSALVRIGQFVRLCAAASLFFISARGQAQDPLTNWNQVFSFPIPINSLDYGNGTCVCVGDGVRAISHDGANWSLYANAPIVNQANVVYGAGYFLSFGTVGQNPATIIFESQNGIHFLPVYTNSQSLFAATFGNNIINLASL